MKRILLIIVSLAGIGGLVALLNYRPANTALAIMPSVSPDSEDTATPSPTPQPTDTPTPTPAITRTPVATPRPTPAGRYRNGTYNGTAYANDYGMVQVQAVISGGRLTNVVFLQMPNSHRESVQIAQRAEPVLLQEAISAQSANVAQVSGATEDWAAFVRSLGSALNQAS
jgi:uncharacterized protein with FMN-binding domain